MFYTTKKSYRVPSMSSTTSAKKKLCWNCDGHVSFEAESCPYCGSHLEKGLEIESSNTKAPPPFEQNEFSHEGNVFKAPFNQTSTPKISIEELQRQEENQDKPWKISENEWEKLTGERFTREGAYEEGEEGTPLIYTLALLLVGSTFFLFSLALFFFSTEGSLTLEWNGGNWYIFFALSVPMLLFGWKYLKEVKT